MDRFKLFIALAQLTGYLGIGAVIGGLLSNGTSTTPYWIGSILLFFGAVLLGMSISAQNDETEKTKNNKNDPQVKDKE